MEVAPSKKIIFQGDECNRFPNSEKVASLSYRIMWHTLPTCFVADMCARTLMIMGVIMSTMPHGLSQTRYHTSKNQRIYTS